MDDLGMRLIKAVLEHKGLPDVQLADIKADDLIDEARRSFIWLTGYLDDHGEYPTERALQEQCKVALPDEADSLKYVIDQVRRRSLSLALRPKLKTILERLENRDPDAVLEEMQRVATSLGGSKKDRALHSFRQDWDKRLKRYQEVQQGPGNLWFSTPWNILDGAIQGWVNGCLHVVGAETMTGKTWFLSYCAAHSLEQKQRVLFVTMEMSEVRVARRVDCCTYKLPFGPMRDGTLDMITEDSWVKKMEGLQQETGEHDIIFAGKKVVKCPADIVALIDRGEYDIVYIDGAYRLSPSVRGRGGQWADQVAVIEELQESAEDTDIPWVCSTQMNKPKSAGGKKGVVRDTRYAREWEIDPDVVIELSQDDDLRLSRMLEITTRKVRDGDGKPVTFKVSWGDAEKGFNVVGGDETELEEEDAADLVEAGMEGIVDY